MIDKTVPDVAAAVAGIADGATVMIGGFGRAGQPVELIDALIAHGAGDLTVVNNNAGNGDTGLAALLAAGQVRKMICSFPRQSDSWVFDGLYRDGKVELELVPQGNLAERIRAAGAGIGGFFTPTGFAPTRRGQGDAAYRRPRLRARIPHPRRRRARERPRRRPLGQPRLPRDRPQLRAHHGRRRHDHRRAGRRDRATRLPRPRGRRDPRLYVDRVVAVGERVWLRDGAFVGGVDIEGRALAPEEEA